jgi:hypothetical protein
MVEGLDPTMTPEELEIPQFPCADRMAFMGSIDGGAIPEVPRYVKMIRRYCQKLGWNPEDMHLYRMRTEFPVLHVLQRIICSFPDWK